MFDEFRNDTSTAVASGLQVLSISELTRLIRGVIEAEDLFADVWVRGEVSNLTRHSSGHIYFCLKDENALIRCVIWQSNARSIRFIPENGMSLLCRGRVSLYDKQGQYQMVLSEVNPDGVGSLYVAYEQLKARLQQEGLFEEAKKKPIPQFPSKIAIITSPTAAALRDMVTIARRRMPSVDLFLIPALMQGTGAEESVAKALKAVDTIPGIDVIVLGRGGGSIEDLWTFNTETVARSMHKCSIPVVSAIGHETDYTLADFVADLRAPTPSAAMEMILPDRQELSSRLGTMKETMASYVRELISRKVAAFDLLSTSACFKYPQRTLEARLQQIDRLEEKLASNYRNIVSSKGSCLGELSARLQSLSPLGVLSRGYSLARRADNGMLIKKLSDVAPGEMIETVIADGVLVSELKEKQEGWN